MIAIWANVSTNRREWLTTEFFRVVNFFIFGGFFVFMTPEILLEIFGYIGTAIVLLSFVMTDIKWMRAINMIGGLISLIYAFIVGNNPVVVLNASLITINGVQLARAIIRDRKKSVHKEPDAAYNNEETKEENI